MSSRNKHSSIEGVVLRPLPESIYMRDSFGHIAEIPIRFAIAHLLARPLEM